MERLEDRLVRGQRHILRLGSDGGVSQSFLTQAQNVHHHSGDISFRTSCLCLGPGPGRAGRTVLLSAASWRKTDLQGSFKTSHHVPGTFSPLQVSKGMQRSTIAEGSAFFMFCHAAARFSLELRAAFGSFVVPCGGNLRSGSEWRDGLCSVMQRRADAAKLRVLHRSWLEVAWKPSGDAREDAMCLSRRL
ncbi:unnamed protein product [Symbiodinium natans]|uniref:Uncharacterized protein n=1 Tax=Symbiodinium natans TaxID=878477 RepID=A0A812KZI1_9DINO|nr:unnamed protein product [Symbiodinium natans]